MACRRPRAAWRPPVSIDRTARPHPRGARYERLAECYLREHGLQLVTRNHRCRGGEIDLIMRDGATLVFVEVRYRRASRFGDALASIDARKQARIVTAAQDFLVTHPGYANSPCRFDVIALGGSMRAPSCDWIAGAFSA